MSRALLGEAVQRANNPATPLLLLCVLPFQVAAAVKARLEARRVAEAAASAQVCQPAVYYNLSEVCRHCIAAGSALPSRADEPAGASSLLACT